MNELWGPVGLAAVTALVVPFALRPLLDKRGVLDVPNHRSSHSRPTLRGGGVGPLIGLVLGGLWALVTLPDPARLPLVVLLLAAVASGLLGLAEDLRGVRVLARAGTQLVIGLVLSIALALAFGTSWWWVPLGALAFAANVNFTNFMDGINGISSLHGLVAGTAFAVLGAVEGLPWLIAIGALVAVTFLAFLPWNLIPPGMFLGDVGSYLLGGVVAATALAAIASGAHPLAALAPLAIYWADTLTTLLRRAHRGEPVLEAHRTHVYQRLTNTGLSHIGAAVIVAALTAACATAGLRVAAGNTPPVAGAFVVALAVIGYLRFPGVRGDVLPRPTPSLPLADVPIPAAATVAQDWSPKTWVVVGATGFIGKGVVQRLRGDGVAVRGVKAPRLQLEPAHHDGRVVADIALSLPETARLVDEFVGADVVVNAAGLATPDASADDALYGANALLPAAIGHAAQQAGVGRVIHLSSAAVQGDRDVLDSSPAVQPFSPYSRSKALGERAALSAAASSSKTSLSIVRATSVQGPGRRTTESLKRIARSPLASVASPGNHPSVVSSLAGLTQYVVAVGNQQGLVPMITLQPWEGLDVRRVLELAGGRSPRVLPAGLCRFVVRAGKAAGTLLPPAAGIARRLEVMWFGQRQERSSTGTHVPDTHLQAAFNGDGGTA